MEDITDEELLEIEALVETALLGTPPFQASVLELIERRLILQKKNPKARMSTITALLRMRARLRSATRDDKE
jgi:hypothetical protein